RQIADDIAVMYLGRVVEQGPADAVLDTPRHPYTAALRAAMPVPDPARAGIRTTLTGDPPSPHTPPPGCPFHTRCPRAAPRCAAELPRPRRLGRSILACHFPVDPA
ncbi:MAG: oligopeptide/dipeptide ABC transporter ATP-binding protein, partial [Pseudomonadota bacterium]